MNDTDEAKKMDKIYIVEDDDNIRKLVCYALKKEGYSVKATPHNCKAVKYMV